MAIGIFFGEMSKVGPIKYLVVHFLGEVIVNYLEVSRVLESLFVLEKGSKRIDVALPYSDWPSCFADTCYV
jgi:hypothetical protein